MRKIYTLFLVTAGFLSYGQQDVQFTQFMNNRIFYNPAVAGTGGAICASAFHRSQWVGFDGAPTTQNINANIPIRSIGGGVGVNITNDQIGYFSNTSAELMYAYQIRLMEGTLGIGAGVSFLNRSLDNAQWIPADRDPSGGGPGSLDGALPANDASGLLVDATFGVYYDSQTYWGGISTTRVIENATAVDNFSGGGTAFRNSRHYYLMGGYNWFIPGSNWEIQPSALVKVGEGLTSTFDVNLTGVYNNKLWGGVTYRLQDAIGAMIGYQFTPAFRGGYSYDIATSNLSGQGGGSHEVFLQYCFKIEIPPRTKGSYKNPRFL